MKKFFALLLVFLGACTMGCASSPSARLETAPNDVVPAPTFVAVDTATLPSTAMASPVPATATVLPSHTPSLTPSSTPTLTLPGIFVGKVISVSGMTVSLTTDWGDVVVLDVPNYAQVSVKKVTQQSSRPAGIRPIEVLQVAQRDNAKVEVFQRNNVIDAVLVTLSDGAIATLVTPTPLAVSTLVPSSTPVATPRYVDLPWGRINLDLPAAESNPYAMSAWCIRFIGKFDQDRLPMWATNPVGMMVGHSAPYSVFNVEMLRKDAAWTTDSSGQKFFKATGLLRHTEDRSDTQHIDLTIYQGTQIVTYMPSDSRFTNGKTDVTIAPSIVPNPFTIDDINQVRIGQIYGIAYGERDLRWPVPLDQINRKTLMNGGDLLVVYTGPMGWQSSCEFFKSKGAISLR